MHNDYYYDYQSRPSLCLSAWSGFFLFITYFLNRGVNFILLPKIIIRNNIIWGIDG